MWLMWIIFLNPIPVGPSNPNKVNKSLFESDSHTYVCTTRVRQTYIVWVWGLAFASWGHP